VTWDRSGRLYVAYGPAAAMSIDRLDLKAGRWEHWADLRPADPAGVKGILRFAVAGDGSAYAFSYERRLSDLYVVDHLR
jgi:hypothetical protein